MILFLEQNGPEKVLKNESKLINKSPTNQSDILIPDTPTKDTMQEEMVLETNNYKSTSNDLQQMSDVASLLLVADEFLGKKKEPSSTQQDENEKEINPTLYPKDIDSDLSMPLLESQITGQTNVGTLRELNMPELEKESTVQNTVKSHSSEFKVKEVWKSCTICGHESSKKYHGDRHYKSHFRKWKRRCVLCNVYFRSRDQLLSHNGMKHTDIAIKVRSTVLHKRGRNAREIHELRKLLRPFEQAITNCKNHGPSSFDCSASRG